MPKNLSNGGIMGIPTSSQPKRDHRVCSIAIIQSHMATNRGNPTNTSQIERYNHKAKGGFWKDAYIITGRQDEVSL